MNGRLIQQRTKAQATAQHVRLLYSLCNRHQTTNLPSVSFCIASLTELLPHLLQADHQPQHQSVQSAARAALLPFKPFLRFNLKLLRAHRKLLTTLLPARWEPLTQQLLLLLHIQTLRLRQPGLPVQHAQQAKQASLIGQIPSSRNSQQASCTTHHRSFPPHALHRMPLQQGKPQPAPAMMPDLPPLPIRTLRQHRNLSKQRHRFPPLRQRPPLLPKPIPQILTSQPRPTRLLTPLPIRPTNLLLLCHQQPATRSPCQQQMSARQLWPPLLQGSQQHPLVKTTPWLTPCKQLAPMPGYHQQTTAMASLQGRLRRPWLLLSALKKKKARHGPLSVSNWREGSEIRGLQPRQECIWRLGLQPAARLM